MHFSLTFHPVCMRCCEFIIFFNAHAFMINNRITRSVAIYNLFCVALCMLFSSILCACTTTENNLNNFQFNSLCCLFYFLHTFFFVFLLVIVDLLYISHEFKTNWLRIAYNNSLCVFYAKMPTITCCLIIFSLFSIKFVLHL
jgi:hypothetical protein